MAAIWYYKVLGETHGPFTANQLREKAATGELTTDAHVRKGEDGKWTSAIRVSGLFASANTTPTAVTAKPSPPKSSPQHAQVEPPPFPSSPSNGSASDLPRTEPPTTKSCPFCTEQISIAARKCKYCGEFLNGSSPAPHIRPDSGPEQIIWEGHPSGLYYLGDWIMGVLLLPFFGIGLIFLIRAVLDARTRVYTHTTKRVMTKSGIISRTTHEVTLADVRSINMVQSLSERICGLGTVQIGSAGTAGIEVEFRGVTDPIRVRDEIRQSKDRVR